jgi:hypothetical protein
MEKIDFPIVSIVFSAIKEAGATRNLPYSWGFFSDKELDPFNG